MINDIFRTLLFFLDKIVYYFIPTVYNFIMTLAGVSVFDVENLKKIANNLYAIIGLFVIFRIAIILLNAIVNPEKLADNQQGASKIFTKFIVALILIVVIPIGFDFLYILQGNVLSSHIIEKVLIGTPPEDGDNTYGNDVAKAALSSFLTCSDALEEISDTNAEARGHCEKLERGFVMAFTPDLGKKSYSLLDDILNEKEKITVSGQKRYVYEYKAVISTVAGVLILLMLINICIDLAVRIVKLGFLQLFSPIAVIGYVDPKGELFNKWLKMVLSTYINLFIRIASISFVTFTLSAINIGGEGLRNLAGKPLTGGTKTVAQIFIIIGLLIFAKEIPKILSGLFNLDEGSVGSLNPFAKLNGMAGAGLIGGGTALAMKGVGGVVGGVSGGVAASKRGGSFWAGAGQGLSKGFGNIGVGAAAKGGIKGIGKSLIGGTFGASNAAGSYAASKVTGKEEKVGLINAMKRGLATTAGGMHETALSERVERDIAKIKGLEAKGKSPYEHEEYGAAVKNLDLAKDKLKDVEAARQLWAYRYQQDPNGTYTGADGKTYRFKDSFDSANQNYISAQKNITHYEKELERMDSIDKYSEDKKAKQLIDFDKARDKAENEGTFKNIPDIQPGSPQSNTTSTLEGNAWSGSHESPGSRHEPPIL